MWFSLLWKFYLADTQAHEYTKLHTVSLLEMLKSNFWIIDYRNEKNDFYSIIVFLIALYRRTA